jgi:hypothetical protein
VQGYRLTDDDLLARFAVPAGQTAVEVYADLFSHLVHDGVHGTVAQWAPPIVHVRDNGNVLVRGARLTDPDALAEMAVPAHEDAVEIPKAAIMALVLGAACD